MRALNRIKTLAAVLTLLLFVTTTSLAGVPGKPIDRPEGPGPSPTEVGEPDTGSGGLPAYVRQLQLLAAAMLGNQSLRRYALPLIRRVPAASAELRQQRSGRTPR